MNKAILSTEIPQVADRLRELGYTVIPSEEIPCKMPYERRHADLQCLIIDDTAFVLSRCTALTEALRDTYHVISCGDHFSGSYPNNVCLSAVKLKNQLICRIASLDDKIKAYCKTHGYELINVHQGYAKCSCATVSDRAVITADRGIAKVLKENEIDVLLIGEGNILLSGADCGFIGGASGYDRENHTLYFCGDITRHPDYLRMKDFCDRYGTAIVCLNEERLRDIGGIIFC